MTTTIAQRPPSVADALRERDLRHLWHPYTDAARFEREPYICFERGEGVYLYDREGRPVLDGIASWWCASLGHGHPRVVTAIQEQAAVLQHSILGNQSHPRAVELAARLAELAPGDCNRVYFAADGASATEAALKMALQYWWNKGVSGRTRFVCLEEGYHGDTLGAVGVGFVQAFHAPFADAVVRGYTAPAPHYDGPASDGRDEAAALEAFGVLERLVAEKHRELAGIILEPLVQGAAGIRIYHPEYLRRLRALCDAYDLLLIADEIAVGFWRTGPRFACDVAGIVPDILCLGKAVTAGYLPLSAAIAREHVFATFRNESGINRDRTFYDGHTFCGNPIAAAAALAAIDVYEDAALQEHVRELESILGEGMAECVKAKCVRYHKCIGMIGMLKIDANAGGAERAREVKQAAYAKGLLVRPLGDVLYLWPPLTATADELQSMVGILAEALRQSSNQRPM
ncbi:MAG: adenosylmethionine--8-amino-7-oxononanoate transaminase [Candidatus Hydrogenedentales bacterium]